MLCCIIHMLTVSQNVAGCSVATQKRFTMSSERVKQRFRKLKICSVEEIKWPRRIKKSLLSMRLHFQKDRGEHRSKPFLQCSASQICKKNAAAIDRLKIVFYIYWLNCFLNVPHKHLKPRTLAPFSNHDLAMFNINSLQGKPEPIKNTDSLHKLIGSFNRRRRKAVYYHHEDTIQSEKSAKRSAVFDISDTFCPADFASIT